MPERTRRAWRTLLSLIALVALSVSLSPSDLPAAGAPDKHTTIDSTGMAVMAGSNAAVARDSAIADALRKAVEQAVGTMVSSDTMVENYQVLRDSVYTRAQGYVKSYSIVGEGSSGGVYQVTVRATVASGDILGDLDALGILHRKAERPRMLFMIAERSAGEQHYSYWWRQGRDQRVEKAEISASEAALKEAFLAKGFSVVDIASDRIGVSDAFRASDISAEGAREAGKRLGAEVVVFGKAVAKEGGRSPGSAVAPYLADITAEVVSVHDGAVLASGRAHGVARHISGTTGAAEALSRASAELAASLITQITAKWSGPRSILVTLKGASDYSRATEFKAMLKSRVRGVDAVYQRRFEPGTASFEIESRLPAQAIADDISRLGGYRVTGSTPNTIEVEAGN